jgi:hypothetical protein
VWGGGPWAQAGLPISSHYADKSVELPILVISIQTFRISCKWEYRHIDALSIGVEEDVRSS